MKQFINRFIFIAACIMVGESMQGQMNSRPNVIIIMADDMGYSDIGCFGSEISTPNLDRLASNGVQLSQFYNAARCCPTRASLLTGLYPHRAGMGWMTGTDRKQPGYTGELNDQCVTIAQVVKPAGYTTYAVGKWHVTSQTKYEGDKKNWPLQRGFSNYFGIIPGAANYFAPVALTSGNDKITPSKDFYLTDAISDTAVSYINRQSGKPFFMYVAFNAPHWPLQAKPGDIEKYENLYQKGWDVLRQQRYEKQQKLGLIGKTVKLNPRDKRVPAWETLSGDEQKLWAKRMAIYAAQIDCLDQGVGRIVAALEHKKLLENTLIIFLSDNGGCAENINRNDTSFAALGSKKSFQSYRINWANMSNTPFKLYKHFVHEGGISAPFIASWPAVIKHHQVITTPANIIDLMPTVAEVAKAVYPTSYNGQPIAPMAGTSLIPLFTGKGIAMRPLFWEHEANRAVRYKNWKLVSKAVFEPPYIGAWELYDMEKDRSETSDLAGKFPAVVNKLSRMWEEWAKANNVYPLRATLNKANAE